MNPEKSTEVIKECVGSKDIDLKDVAELKYYKKEKFDLWVDFKLRKEII